MIDHCSKTCRFCVSCSPGQFLTKDKTCETCPVDSYNNEVNAKVCIPCPIGHASKAGSTKSDACTECKPGTYVKKGSGSCETCPLNTYSTSAAVVCTDCPDGYFSKPGSTKLSDCVKPPETCKDALHTAECEEHNKAGHCNSKDYISKLKLACKKTCAFCVAKETTEKCEDLEDHCEYWSSLGYCSSTSQYYTYMQQNCKKSCGKCKASKCVLGADLDPSNTCRIWKAQGYCSTSYDYMKDRCSKTCQICKGEKTSYASTQCVDKVNYCPGYVGAGYCYTNKAYMTQYCAKSCGFCKTSFCQDQNMQCGGWASSGECSRNPAYMNLNCKASCNKCSKLESSNAAKTDSTSSCMDYNTLCSYWADNRQCQANPSYMMSYCRKSCNSCGVKSTSTTCTDQHTSCPYWASIQQCYYNPGYMHNVCKLSCKLCKSVAASSTGSSGSCSDKDSRCAAWAANYQCYHNPRYMDVNCAKSCKKCGGGARSGVSSGGRHCVDKNNHCRTYVKTYRYCQYGNTYYNYMQQNCQKSCGWC